MLEKFLTSGKTLSSLIKIIFRTLVPNGGVKGDWNFRISDQIKNSNETDI